MESDRCFQIPEKAHIIHWKYSISNIRLLFASEEQTLFIISDCIVAKKKEEKKKKEKTASGRKHITADSHFQPIVGYCHMSHEIEQGGGLGSGKHCVEGLILELLRLIHLSGCENTSHSPVHSLVWK